jgi:hypothetical protein
MLATEPHGVAAAQARVEQHIEPYPLPRADRPPALVGGDVFLGPGREALAPLLRRLAHSRARVNFDQLRALSPFEQPAHRFEEVPSLERGLCAPVATSLDGSRRDVRDRLLSPALAMTCRKICSRWRLVAEASDVQASTSR